MDLFDVVQLRYPDESFWNPNYLQPEGPCEHMLVSTLKTVSFTIGVIRLLTSAPAPDQQWCDDRNWMVWQFNFDLYLILTEAEEKWKYMKIFYCSVVYTFLSIFNMNSLQISLFSVDRNSDKFNCIERMGTEVSQQVGWHRKQTIAWQWKVFIHHKTKHLDGAQREFFPRWGCGVYVWVCQVLLLFNRRPRAMT